MSNKAASKPDVSPSRTTLKEWKVLQEHAQNIASSINIGEECANNPHRFEEFSARHEGILLDFSKQKIEQKTVSLLLKLLKSCHFESMRDDLFNGARINNTEDRGVLHTALRAPKTPALFFEEENIMEEIHDVLLQMKDFCGKFHAEKRFRHVVNIGIGGSDLGSYMVCEALKPFCHPDLDMHFVSNVDSTHLSEALRKADPDKTLFIVTSKTFTTQETITNANSAREWLQKSLGKEDVSGHFVGVTVNTDNARAFGIPDDRIFPIWDWVGGRFSLWSAVSLSVCLAIGYDNFRAMLDGAHSMDAHFQNAPLEKNLPVLLAMIGIWNRNFLGHDILAVLPYDQYLHRFPAYIQQLDMESNGKSVTRAGNEITDYKTGAIVFGEPGTNGQHAFFQLIHQGTTIIPCEFIACKTTHNPMGDHYPKLMSNALGQTKAMMDGRNHENPHRVFKGNRPSITLLIDKLDPYHLGMLLALYEHKIFVQGVVWDVNSFDQWGVELGKEIAGQILQHFQTPRSEPLKGDLDSSTQGLLNEILKS